MKHAEDLYDDCRWLADYQPMLDEFGEILLQVDDDDYQGDSRVLYKNNDKIGWLQFGWGSCSGCDALHACKTYEAIDELMLELYNSIKWFDSSEEALKFFQSHDWKMDYSYHQKEQKEFIKQAINILKE